MLFKIVAALALLGAASAATTKIVCYWGTWSVYRNGNAKFTVDNVDPNLCTHIIYGFVGIETSGNVRLLDSYLDVDLENFKRLNDLKLQNPNLKTLLAIGGWNEGSENYSNVVGDAAKRATFISSALNLVLTYGFNGFDLDWEYPNQRGGVYADIANYATLLKEFREAFDQHGLLLTAAVAAASASVDLSYDVPSLSKYLDIINVMTYDLHGSWEEVTGQNAPLYASSLDVTYADQQLNVNAAIRGWISRGADPQKIALGLGAYGRTFTLATSSANTLGAAITGAGAAGKYTQEAGMLGYNEIVELQNEGGWTIVWDNEQKTPYMTKGNQWVSYDNPQSIAVKVAYAKSLDLGGIMTWSIDTDDFTGVSGTKFPLLKAMNSVLAGDVVVTQAPVEETKPQTEAPVEETKPETEAPVEEAEETEAAPEVETETEAAPEAEPELEEVESTDPVTLCIKVGYVRDPVDCSVYHYCQAVNGGFKVITQQCSNNLYYDLTLEACNYKSQVSC